MHRVQHRVVSATTHETGWKVVTRTAPPALQWELLSTWVRSRLEDVRIT
ncbi:hypothetical protein [Kribbella endophytica]